jgi:hypothetical protein
MKAENIEFSPENIKAGTVIEERAWHSASLINDKIYYFGGV